MKVFSINLYRYQLVKIVIGIGVLAYLVRAVLGITDTVQVMGITLGGLTEVFLLRWPFPLLCSFGIFVTDFTPDKRYGFACDFLIGQSLVFSYICSHAG